jgi:hypothetical protein
MAYGRRRYSRGPSPQEEARQRREARYKTAQKRVARLLNGFEKITLSGDAAQYAWKQPAIRSFEIGEMQSSPISVIIRRDSATGALFIQEPGAVGWSFYVLIPRKRQTQAEKRETRRLEELRSRENAIRLEEIRSHYGRPKW